jgi:hypothetical protein
MRFVSAVFLTLLTTGTAQAADMIKAGKWEFSAQVQVPNMPKHPPTQQHGKCNVGAVNKNGNTVTWETSCPQSDGSVVHSDGVAHYTGDTMEATIKTRVTGGTGGISETSQHITGRYLGACDAK